MTASKTPYRPGFSKRPPLLAGRDEILLAAQEALALAADDAITPNPLLLVGPRGVGKTVLLSEIARRAGAQYGWPRLQLELTGQPFIPQLLAGVQATADLLDQSTAPERMRLTDTTVRAGLPGLGAELHFTRGQAAAENPPARVLDALGALADRAAAHNAGVLITLDELQLSERVEIAEFGAALQRAMEEGWPLLIVGAGLDSMRSERRLPTYFERADWHELGALEPAATRAALLDPARTAGRPFTTDAGEYLAGQTGGYPYAIQLFGHQAWRASRTADAIDITHARLAAHNGALQLASGLYANRWAQASPRERDYLIAAAEEQQAQGAIRGGAVAHRLGVTAQSVSQPRSRLIAKGVLTSVGQELRFAIPGMAQYVLTMRQDHPATSQDGQSKTRTRESPER